MRKSLEDFYYGNIAPFKRQMTPNSELKRAVDRVTRCERQLTERLDENEKTILTKLIQSQQDIDSITARKYRAERPILPQKVLNCTPRNGQEVDP